MGTKSSFVEKTSSCPSCPRILFLNCTVIEALYCVMSLSLVKNLCMKMGIFSFFLACPLIEHNFHTFDCPRGGNDCITDHILTSATS